MKIILSTLLLFATFSTFSQTSSEIYVEEDLLGYKDQGINTYAKELTDKNREKALSVVAPIDDAVENLRANGQLSEPANGSTLESLIESSTNKRKMVDYSDVKFEEGYTKNEDGTWSPKEKYISKEENKPIAEKPDGYKEMEPISILSKIFTVIMLIMFWFVAGFVINFIIYNNRPEHELGTSSVARYLHILTNIALVIMILVTLSR
jgi:hypothetical protein